MGLFQSKRKSFSKIYDKYVDKIYRFVFLKVNSREVAQDLTSETFLRGWRVFEQSEISASVDTLAGKQNSPSRNQIKNPQAFLFKIARNLVIDYYREKGRAQIVSTEDEQIMAPLDLEEKASLSSDMKLIRECLSELKEDYQDVLIWHYLEGLSFREIAQIVERPEGTIRVMAHRALKKLREMIENEQ